MQDGTNLETVKVSLEAEAPCEVALIITTSKAPYSLFDHSYGKRYL